MKTPPELEQLPARVAGLEVEVRTLRDKLATAESTVAHLKRANASYSAGFATRHREEDERRAQLRLARFWGAELVDRLVEARAVAAAARAEYDAHECETIAGGALDAQAEAERRLFAVVRAGDHLREWLAAARKLAHPERVETLAELEALLGEWDAAKAGFG